LLPPAKGMLWMMLCEFHSARKTLRGMLPLATDRTVAAVGLVMAICAVLILPSALIETAGALCAAEGLVTSNENTYSVSLAIVSPDARARVRVPELKDAVLPKSVSPPLPPDTDDRGTVPDATAPVSPVMEKAVLCAARALMLMTSVTVSVLVPPARGMLCPISAVVKKIS